MGHIRLFVLMDGVGWKHLQETDFAVRLCPYRKSLQTILGYSSGALPTILSGRMPSETRQWAMWFYSPATSPFGWAARRVRYPRVVKRLMKMNRDTIVAGFKERNHITGYCETYRIPEEILPLVDTCAKRSWYLPTGLGGVESIFDVWTRRGTAYEVSGYPTSDFQSLLQVAEGIRRNPKPVYFLHLYETDAFLHARCRDVEAFRAALDPYQRSLEDICARAQAGGATLDLVIFSDHGMTPTAGEFDVMREIERLGLEIGRDYVPLYDSTMARFWFFDPQAEARTVEALRGLRCGRVLPEEELRRLGVFFPDYQFGKVVFLMNPGWIINPSHMGTTAPAGMHGFHPDEDPWADAMLLSTRPIPDRVRHIADLFDLMRLS